MTLNVAVIGIGAMGRNHARVYSEIEDINLVAVCDINEKAVHLCENKGEANI